MEKIKIVANVKGLNKKGLNNWQSIKITSREEFPHHFSSKFGHYYGFVYGKEEILVNIPRGRDVVLVCKDDGKFLSCDDWYVEKLENKTQIINFLYFKLNNERRDNNLLPLISKARIEELVSVYADKTIELFENDCTNKLMPFFNDALDVIEACKVIQSLTAIDTFYRFMAENGIKRNIASKVWEKYGDKSLKIVKTNPFFCMEIDGVGFKTCDSIARKLNIALDSKERVVAATREELKKMTSTDGNTSEIDVDLCKNTLRTLNEDSNVKVNAKMWFETINQVRSEKGRSPFMILNDENLARNKRVMLEEDNANEFNSSRKIVSMLLNSHGNPEAVEYADRINEHREIKLSNGQMAAVKKALNSPFSIITGGPGVGKTTVIKVILEAYEKTSKDTITCLAPTGKAASRMSEATGRSASTIHSALKIIPGVDSSAIMLPKGLVVVDEVSMVDQEILAKLMEAIPVNNQVILVGDVDQLPSVGKGDCLNQLIKSGVIPVARLTETFRQKKGSLIIDNAYKVNSGKTDLQYDSETFQFFSMNDESIEEFKNLYSQKINQYGVENVMVLCPRRREVDLVANPGQKELNFVSDKLNRILQDVVNPFKGEDSETSIYAEGKKKVFRVNDRVMQWRNTGKVSNGDIGVIQNIYVGQSGETTFKIKWEIADEDNITEYKFEDMKDVSLAYAMSIHKSQGSEAKCVLMPFMSEHGSNMQRNLLYTGITRAKQECIIVGDKRAVDNCIKTEVTGKRSSYLSIRLAKKMQYEKNN